MKKLFYTFALLSLVFLTGCVGEKAAKTEKLCVIFETDMGNDVDDAMALDMLYKYMDAGLVDLLAIMVNKDSGSAAQYIDMFGTWYGYPDIPVGVVRDGVTFEPGSPFLESVIGLRNEDGSAMFARSHSDYDKLPDAHILYRKILAQQPDYSVVIASVGFSTNLARLLDTPADEYSPLTGKELVARKVRLLSSMAGHLSDPDFREFNVAQDVASAQKVFAEWPTEVVVSPFELGVSAKYPWDRFNKDLSWAEKHPIIESCMAFHQRECDQNTFDLTSVLYAVEGPSCFTVSGPGRFEINDEGISVFTPCENGNAKYLVADDATYPGIIDCFSSLLSRRPLYSNPK